MTTYLCPLCGAPMSSQFKPSDHPAIPDRTYLHCQNKACDLAITTDDLPTIDLLQYAGEALTAKTQPQGMFP